jgi:hypothetical protein
MTASDQGLGAGTRTRVARWSPENLFYAAMSLAIVCAVVLGFARSFFLRPLFRGWAEAHSAPETFFYFHGAIFTAWLVLLPAQSVLVATGRMRLHRRLGRIGAWVAAVMVVVGCMASLIAARRPTGFVDVPVPPLQFLATPLGDMLLFSSFVSLALWLRHQPQSHKRLMLLASISISEAGIARWPFGAMTGPSPVPGFARMDLVADAFLLPMLAWDLASRGRPHPVTLWGGAVLLASHPLRALLSQTEGWLAFARWAVGS